VLGRRQRRFVRHAFGRRPHLASPGLGPWRKSNSGRKRKGPFSWNSHWTALSGTPSSASGDT
jgi:hypothetical protein